MSFKTEQQENFTVIKFSTEMLDAIVAPDLKAELVLLNKNGARNILIDLESVKYCDSSGLSALLIGHRICNEANGTFIISSLQPSVQKLIIISQLDTVLTIKKSLEEAVNSVFVDEIERNLGAE